MFAWQKKMKTFMVDIKKMQLDIDFDMKNR